MCACAHAHPCYAHVCTAEGVVLYATCTAYVYNTKGKRKGNLLNQHSSATTHPS